MFPTGVGMNRVEDVPPLLAFYVPYRRGDNSVSNIYPIKLFAPRAGAWIETKSQSLRGIYLNVAPRAGAWIETRDRESDIGGQKSVEEPIPLKQDLKTISYFLFPISIPFLNLQGGSIK